MIKKITFLLCALLISLTNSAQTDTPALEHVMDLNVKVGEAYSVGKTPEGYRNIVPITGGTFTGATIKGTVISGGADYQMHSHDKSRSELEAIYCLRTDDGVNIHIRNRGIVAGKYFYCTPTFEAPTDSKYAWLNNAIFVCRPMGFAGSAVQLRVWMVKDSQ